ncbi:ABC transporter permease [Olsenella profusa]|uniref:ABC transporter permease n=1 Tax=Olsenella profusa TaxID=138595 RepID=A0ABS2F2X7_9ACTN|nr:ABC transporter permease [Olsenella profusa]MBM6775344.1 ABC transporter permease [Olsenella profusa]
MARHFHDEKNPRGEKDHGVRREGRGRHARGEKDPRAGTAGAPAAAVPRGNVFTRFTLRSLAANRVRTTVTVVGVALACGLLTAVLASVTSLRSALVTQRQAQDGVWQVSFDYTDPKKLDELRTAAGEKLDRLATWRDLGAAALPADSAADSGVFLGVLTLPQEQDGTAHAAGDDAYDVVRTPEVTEGRLPESPGEIALPDYLRGRTLGQDADSALPGVAAGASSDGDLELGSTVTLALGRRTLATGGVALPSGSYVSGDLEYEQGEDGVFRATVSNASESLADVGAPRTHTVVGFVEITYNLGDAALVCPDEPAATASGDEISTAFFSTTGFASTSEIADMLAGIGVDGYRTNDSLLMYQGLDNSRAIFDSLGQFAAVLAAVIVVAAVSLISNAFTISISERTRQFGLLSSLGASRRQLRRTVYTEAAVLGALGIPLGLVLGVGGAAAVFALTADGWSAIVGAGVSVGLALRASDLVLAVVLTALTLLLSAFVPAVRAGRVSAVDAIRGARDVRPSRRLRRVFRHRRDAMDDLSADGRRPRGLAARLGGMPAFLARRTLAVSASKSRVAVVSLAVSIALLVTAGLVSDYLTGATSYLNTGGAADLELYASLASGTSAGRDLADLRENPLTDELQDVVDELSGVSGVARAYGTSQVGASVRLDPACVNWDGIDAFDESMRGSMGGFALGRDGWGSALVCLVDDGTWAALAGRLGFTGAEADPASLACVVLNRASVTTSGSYGSVAPLTGAPGSLELLAPPADLTDDQWLDWDAERGLGIITLDPETGDEGFKPAEEAGLASLEVPVAAATDELGDDFPLGTREMGDTNRLVLVMPLAAVLASDDACAALTANGYTRYLASFAADADEEATVEAAEAIIDARDDLELGGSNNIAESTRQARAMDFTVRVFLYCFVAITMAIAVANVFNTIASGLMLRTREFAALQSAGMGRRAFRRMIFLECADFAVKGLLGGVALAAVVNVGLFWALSSSFSTLVLDMPWGHVALAFAVVVAVLAASAGYALHKTHALNLVEALRTEAL